MNTLARKYLLLTLFAIAMGYLESAVVVYMRELMYPGGFDFPLAPFEPHIALTEIFRETATLIMLLLVGFLAGRTPTERFGVFLFCFAVWDIFYYIFLYLLIGWPESLLTWDILFLLPTTWVGPVIAPVIISLIMIMFALLISRKVSRFGKAIIGRVNWLLLSLGSLLLIFGFCLDYSKYVLKHYSFGDLFTLSESALTRLATHYIPVNFNWPIFLAGTALILFAIFRFERTMQTP